MKLKTALLICFFASAVSLWAKPESKQPDSYAYTRGVEAFKEEKYDEAMDWFNRELEEHPDNGYAYLYISAYRYVNSEFGKALSAINSALKKLPKKDKEYVATAYRTRGEIYFAMEDTVSGLRDYDMMIKTEPQNPENYEHRAQLYFDQCKFDLSDADYQKMISLDPGNTMGYMGIGRNAKVQGNYDDAIERFSYVIKMEPAYSSGYSFRADCYMLQGKWAEATDDLVKALDIDGDDKSFYMMQNLPQEASDMLKAKLRIQMTKQPTNIYWPYCIAVLADSNNDPDEAITYYEKAYSIDANPELLKSIAKCHIKKEDYAKALDYADRALAMVPEDYEAIDLKANILSHLGRFDECLAERDRYVAKFPDFAPAYLYRADDLLGARRFNDAIEDYNTAVVLAPLLAEYPYLLMRRGDAYRFAGKHEESKKDYETLLVAEKDSVLTAGSWTPFAYSGLGNAEKAIETMQYILANDTTDSVGTLYNAACMYGRLGQKAESIRYLREAIEKGYSDFRHIENDYDLDCLRSVPEYQELIDRLQSENAGGPNKDSDDSEDYRTETVEIPFSKENGVTKVKCAINDLPLHFVFDTGAADVTMSMVEANFMLKNDYIKPTDIIGAAQYMDANGDITEGTIVNLQKVNFGGLELDNVRASVVRNQKAPLLLGQSVLGRLGKIEIDNPGMKLVITHKVNK